MEVVLPSVVCEMMKGGMTTMKKLTMNAPMPYLVARFVISFHAVSSVFLVSCFAVSPNAVKRFLALGVFHQLISNINIWLAITRMGRRNENIRPLFPLKSVINCSETKPGIAPSNPTIWLMAITMIICHPPVRFRRLSFNRFIAYPFCVYLL